MQRIVVIGTSGSGKSTLAEQAAARLNAPFVELDGLHFPPEWGEVSVEEFRRRVNEAISGERWAVAGNYADVRDLIWQRADTLVWLDYPLPLVFWRLFRRTIKRVVRQEDLWDTGNRETWQIAFLSRHSVLYWLLKTYPGFAAKTVRLLQAPEHAHLRVLRFKAPGEAEAWVKTVGERG